MTQTCSAVALFFLKKLNKNSSFLFFLNEVNRFLSHHMLTSVRSLCNSVCNPHWRAGSPKCLWEPLCVHLEEGGPKRIQGCCSPKKGKGGPLGRNPGCLPGHGLPNLAALCNGGGRWNTQMARPPQLLLVPVWSWESGVWSLPR